MSAALSDLEGDGTGGCVVVGLGAGLAGAVPGRPLKREKRRVRNVGRGFELVELIKTARSSTNPTVISPDRKVYILDVYSWGWSKSLSVKLEIPDPSFSMRM
jgi:hypothetical protein